MVTKKEIKWTQRGIEQNNSGKCLKMTEPTERQYVGEKIIRHKRQLKRDLNARRGGLDPVTIGVNISQLNLDEQYGNIASALRKIPSYIKLESVSRNHFRLLNLVPGTSYFTTAPIDEHYQQEHPLPFMRRAYCDDEGKIRTGSFIMLLGGFDIDERFTGADIHDGIVQKIRVHRYVFLYETRRFILGDLNLIQIPELC